MDNLKSCPLPKCGGIGRPFTMSPDIGSVACDEPGCPLGNGRFTPEQWQSLPRHSGNTGECDIHPEAVCGECAECEKHKELVACFSCYSKAARNAGPTATECPDCKMLRDGIESLHLDKTVAITKTLDATTKALVLCGERDSLKIEVETLKETNRTIVSMESRREEETRQLKIEVERLKGIVAMMTNEEECAISTKATLKAERDEARDALAIETVPCPYCEDSAGGYPHEPCDVCKGSGKIGIVSVPAAPQDNPGDGKERCGNCEYWGKKTPLGDPVSCHPTNEHDHCETWTPKPDPAPCLDCKPDKLCSKHYRETTQEECAKCARWEKEYISLEEIHHAEKGEVLEALGELHVAKTLHSVAVTERENMAAEKLRLEIRLEDALNKCDPAYVKNHVRDLRITLWAVACDLEDVEQGDNPPEHYLEEITAIIRKATKEGLIFDPVGGGKISIDTEKKEEECFECGQLNDALASIALILNAANVGEVPFLCDRVKLLWGERDEAIAAKERLVEELKEANKQADECMVQADGALHEATEAKEQRDKMLAQRDEDQQVVKGFMDKNGELLEEVARLRGRLDKVDD